MADAEVKKCEAIATNALAELLSNSRSRSTAEANLLQANILLSQCTDVEAANEAYLTLLERSNSDPNMAERWLAFHHRWPTNRNGLRCAARLMAQQKKVDEAIFLVENRYDLVSGTEKDWTDCANLLASCGLTERSFEIFNQLMSSGMDSVNVRTTFAKRLKKSGLFIKANQVMEPIRGKLKRGSQQHVLAEELRYLATAIPSSAESSDRDLRLDLMLQIVSHYEAERRNWQSSADLGKMCFITGSLALGGAEQQMVRIAMALNKFASKAESFCVATETVSRKSIIASVGDRGPSSVAILVRSLDASNRHDLLLKLVQSAGIPVNEAEEGRIYSAERIHDALALYPEQYRSVLENLPSTVSRGIEQFYPVFQRAKYDTVSIWQDGAVAYAALPALMAGVHNIVLVFRGLPPNIRRYLDKPEFAPFFAVLAKINGVTLAANSQAAASEYERWLNLPAGTVQLVPNGVPPPDQGGSDDDEVAWADFKLRTADAQYTIGMVGRLVHVKRPFDWIKTAAAIYRRDHRTRFVMVGEGALMHDMRLLAEAEGIRDRILFTGYTERVGFWLSKLDTLMLLSRYEGLPNALIEAQASGIPVVATPVGGSAECFIDGKTGRLLPFLETVDHNTTADTVLELLQLAAADRNMADCARSYVHSRFSIAQSIRSFLSVL